MKKPDYKGAKTHQHWLSSTPQYNYEIYVFDQRTPSPAGTHSIPMSLPEYNFLKNLLAASRSYDWTPAYQSDKVGLVLGADAGCMGGQEIPITVSEYKQLTANLARLRNLPVHSFPLPRKLLNLLGKPRDQSQGPVRPIHPPQASEAE